MGDCMKPPNASAAGWTATKTLSGCVAAFLLMAGSVRAQPPEPLPVSALVVDNDPAARALAEMMRRVVLPRLDVEDSGLDEVVDHLRARSAEPGKANRSFSVVIRYPLDGERPPPPRVTLKAEDITLFDAFALVADKADMRVLVGPFAVTFAPKISGPVVEDDPAAREIAEAMKRIVLPFVDFGECDLGEAIDFLRSQSRGGEGRRIDFVILAPPDGENPPPRVTLKARNTPLFDAVSLVADQAGMKAAVDAYAVTFVSRIPEGGIRKAPEPQGPAANLARKLILTVVNFEDVSLEEAMDFLQQRSAELDPGQKGLRIEIAPEADSQAEIKELRLRNVPISQALRYCCEATRHQWTDDNGVIRISR